jgi:hypothetical protein
MKEKEIISMYGKRVDKPRRIRRAKITILVIIVMILLSLIISLPFSEVRLPALFTEELEFDECQNGQQKEEYP